LYSAASAAEYKTIPAVPLNTSLEGSLYTDAAIPTPAISRTVSVRKNLVYKMMKRFFGHFDLRNIHDGFMDL